MKLNANDMPVFAAVVEKKGISAAARALDRPKSSVSNSVSRLEAALGLRLLERNSRQIRMTSEGESFYKHCLLLAEQLAAAEATMSGLQVVPSGRLTVSITMAFSRVILGGHLAEFIRRYPEIELDVRISNQQVNVISEAVDVAIKIGPQPDSELITTHLMETPVVWVASPDYLARNEVIETPQGVLEHLKIIDKRYSQVDFTVRKGRQKQALDIQCTRYSNDPLMVREMVVSGAGISLVPYIFCRQELDAGTLRQLASDWVVEPASLITAVYPSRRLISAKTRLFIDFLKEIIAEESGSVTQF